MVSQRIRSNALPGRGRHTRHDDCIRGARLSGARREEAPARILRPAVSSREPRCDRIADRRTLIHRAAADLKCPKVIGHVPEPLARDRVDQVMAKPLKWGYGRLGEFPPNDAMLSNTPSRRTRPCKSAAPKWARKVTKNR